MRQLIQVLNRARLTVATVPAAALSPRVMDPAALFSSLDENGDGELSLAEVSLPPRIVPPYRYRAGCAPAPATGCASGVAAGADSTYRGPGRVRGSCQQGVTPPALPALSRAAAAPATISLASGDAFELREALHLDARDRGLTITKWGASPHRPLISGGHTIPKWSRVAPDDAQQRDAGSNR